MKNTRTDSTELSTEAVVTENSGISMKKKRKHNAHDGRDRDQSVPECVRPKKHHKKRKLDSAAEEQVAVGTSTEGNSEVLCTSTPVTKTEGKGSEVESSDGVTDSEHISGKDFINC